MKLQLAVAGFAIALIHPTLGFAQASAPSTHNSVVLAETWTTVYWAVALNPDCTLVGPTTIRFRKMAQHGTAEIVQEGGFAAFPPGNPRSACNSHQVTLTKIYYTSSPDFTGQDSIDMEIFSPNGISKTVDVTIVVKK